MKQSAERPNTICLDTGAPGRARVMAQDHDLPILAIRQNRRQNLDWESLLVSGVQPALALGAERRRQGRR